MPIQNFDQLLAEFRRYFSVKSTETEGGYEVRPDTWYESWGASAENKAPEGAFTEKDFTLKRTAAEAMWVPMYQYILNLYHSIAGAADGSAASTSADGASSSSPSVSAVDYNEHTRYARAVFAIKQNIRTIKSILASNQYNGILDAIGIGSDRSALESYLKTLEIFEQETLAIVQDERHPNKPYTEALRQASITDILQRHRTIAAVHSNNDSTSSDSSTEEDLPSHTRDNADEDAAPLTRDDADEPTFEITGPRPDLLVSRISEYGTACLQSPDATELARNLVRYNMLMTDVRAHSNFYTDRELNNQRRTLRPQTILISAINTLYRPFIAWSETQLSYINQTLPATLRHVASNTEPHAYAKAVYGIKATINHLNAILNGDVQNDTGIRSTAHIRQLRNALNTFFTSTLALRSYKPTQDADVSEEESYASALARESAHDVLTQCLVRAERYLPQLTTVAQTSTGSVDVSNLTSTIQNARAAINPSASSSGAALLELSREALVSHLQRLIHAIGLTSLRTDLSPDALKSAFLLFKASYTLLEQRDIAYTSKDRQGQITSSSPLIEIDTLGSQTCPFYLFVRSAFLLQKNLLNHQQRLGSYEEVNAHVAEFTQELNACIAAVTTTTADDLVNIASQQFEKLFVAAVRFQLHMLDSDHSLPTRVRRTLNGIIDLIPLMAPAANASLQRSLFALFAQECEAKITTYQTNKTRGVQTSLSREHQKEAEYIRYQAVELLNASQVPTSDVDILANRYKLLILSIDHLYNSLGVTHLNRSKELAPRLKQLLDQDHNLGGRLNALRLALPHDEPSTTASQSAQTESSQQQSRGPIVIDAVSKANYKIARAQIAHIEKKPALRIPDRETKVLETLQFWATPIPNEERDYLLTKQIMLAYAYGILGLGPLPSLYSFAKPADSSAAIVSSSTATTTDDYDSIHYSSHLPTHPLDSQIAAADADIAVVDAANRDRYSSQAPTDIHIAQAISSAAKLAVAYRANPGFVNAATAYILTATKAVMHAVTILRLLGEKNGYIDNQQQVLVLLDSRLRTELALVPESIRPLFEIVQNAHQHDSTTILTALLSATNNLATNIVVALTVLHAGRRISIQAIATQLLTVLPTLSARFVDAATTLAITEQLRELVANETSFEAAVAMVLTASFVAAERIPSDATSASFITGYIRDMSAAVHSGCQLGESEAASWYTHVSDADKAGHETRLIEPTQRRSSTKASASSSHQDDSEGEAEYTSSTTTTPAKAALAYAETIQTLVSSPVTVSAETEKETLGKLSSQPKRDEEETDDDDRTSDTSRHPGIASPLTPRFFEDGDQGETGSAEEEEVIEALPGKTIDTLPIYERVHLLRNVVATLLDAAPTNRFLHTLNQELNKVGFAYFFDLLNLNPPEPAQVLNEDNHFGMRRALPDPLADVLPRSYGDGHRDADSRNATEEDEPESSILLDPHNLTDDSSSSEDDENGENASETSGPAALQTLQDWSNTLTRTPDRQSAQSSASSKDQDHGGEPASLPTPTLSDLLESGQSDTFNPSHSVPHSLRFPGAPASSSIPSSRPAPDDSSSFTIDWDQPLPASEPLTNLFDVTDLDKDNILGSDLRGTGKKGSDDELDLHDNLPLPSISGNNSPGKSPALFATPMKEQQPAIGGTSALLLETPPEFAQKPVERKPSPESKPGSSSPAVQLIFESVPKASDTVPSSVPPNKSDDLDLWFSSVNKP